MNGIPGGIWPTMITPFTENGQVDFDAVERIVDWYADQGCDGIFAVCQSSEMFHLTLRERVGLARAVVDASRGRLAVIASGHTSDPLRQQIDELSAMAGTGVRAVVLVSNRLASADEDEEAWLARGQTILDALPGVTFGMYECPHPYKRLMTDGMIDWCVRSGRFAFLKDTCCSAPLIRRRLEGIAAASRDAGIEPMGLYNANTLTLLETLRYGAAGFSGVMANLHPELYAWLYRNWKVEPERADQLQSLLTLLSGLEGHGYPICAKQHMRDIGIEMALFTRSRPAEAFDYAARETLRQAEIVENIARRLCGIL